MYDVSCDTRRMSKWGTTMKKLLFVLLFTGLFVAVLSAAQAQYLQCGIPPIPPLGCSGPPHCVCSSYGCQWVWDCNQ